MKKLQIIFLFLLPLLSCQKLSITAQSIAIDSTALLRQRAIKTATVSETIVILGSSTAWGMGATQRSSAWAGLLTSYLTKDKIINLAVPGYTTYHILENGTINPADRPAPDTLANITAALKKKPTILIVSMTTNDVAGGFSVDEILTNLEIIHKKALAKGVRRFIVTTPHPRRISSAATLKYLDQRDRILKKYGTDAVNFFDAVADSEYYFRPEYLYSDGIHPNDAGHAVLFEQVKKVINR